jgi:hypothetical protein
MWIALPWGKVMSYPVDWCLVRKGISWNIAQLVEHLTVNQSVTGSIPVIPVTLPVV